VCSAYKSAPNSFKQYISITATQQLCAVPNTQSANSLAQYFNVATHPSSISGTQRLAASAANHYSNTQQRQQHHATQQR
jgi:hypothetical protein